MGISLGIYPLFQGKKICAFDCVYCQLGGPGTLTVERKVFVTEDRVLAEPNSPPPLKMGYVTFSGAG